MADLPDWTRRFLQAPVLWADRSFDFGPSGALNVCIGMQPGIRYEIVQLTIVAEPGAESSGYGIRGVVLVTLQDASGVLLYGAISPEAPAWSVTPGEAAVISHTAEDIYVQGTTEVSVGSGSAHVQIAYREIG